MGRCCRSRSEVVNSELLAKPAALFFCRLTWHLRISARFGGAMKACSSAVCVMEMLMSSLRAQDTPGAAAQPPAKAETAAPSGSQRPRIGLVLEGGGAL